MTYYLHQARLSRSKSHPNWVKFKEECDLLRAKYPGYGGFDGLALISTTQSAQNIKYILEAAVGQEYIQDISVDEITTNSIFNGNDGYLLDDIKYLENYHSYDNIDTDS
ncbi:hypothetical protein [Gluconobacter sp. P5B12]|uniref:hypothetical protein n=1 Tax=unclassified Gluconobacter TaxID=2644261 RepID=UPI001C05C676|nr:hypothetical protein [Gluconobacter sp. P5B12]